VRTSPTEAARQDDRWLGRKTDRHPRNRRAGRKSNSPPRGKR
jgi:hypothetical protein